MACSRGRLEATAAVLTGVRHAYGMPSIWTTERLLRMWSAPPVAPLHGMTSWLSRELQRHDPWRAATGAHGADMEAS
jgi:hypothetical protein